MKAFIQVTIFLITVSLAFTACDQPLTDAQKAEIEKEITALTHEIFDQFNNRDTGIVYTNFDEDFIALSMGAYLIKDAENFVKYTTKAKQSIAERDPFEYKISDLSVDVYSKDVASVYYKYTRTNMYEDDLNIVNSSASTWTFVKKDGEWKIKHAHISSGADRYRAVKEEPVWVFINKIKADKKEVFEELMYSDITKNSKEAGGARADIVSKVRILNPMNPDEDGNFTYVFIMDPVIEGVDYNIRSVLLQFFSEEVANEKMKLWADCYAEPQYGYFLTQN
jgi:phenylpyruvate tautomerase PptA (4-oxalocrotonate tautomerase family)